MRTQIFGFVCVFTAKMRSLKLFISGPESHCVPKMEFFLDYKKQKESIKAKKMKTRRPCGLKAQNNKGKMVLNIQSYLGGRRRGVTNVTVFM